jgi:hypothetical protein
VLCLGPEGQTPAVEVDPTHEITVRDVALVSHHARSVDRDAIYGLLMEHI